MSKTINLAVVGAAGLVGKAVLELLEQRDFPVGKLYCLEKDDATEETLLYKNHNYEIETWLGFDFSKVDIALFAEVDGSEVELTVAAGKAGAVVITNQPVFRHAQGIPLVVAGVNDEQIAHYSRHNIIATPDSTTCCVATALKGIYDSVGIAAISLNCAQAVSSAGAEGISELATQTARLLNVQSIEPKVFAQQIAFNVLSGVGEMLDSGYSREEFEIAQGLQKVLEDHSMEVEPAIIQVPVFYGDSIDVSLRTQQAVSLAEAGRLLTAQPGVELSNTLTSSPVEDGAGSEGIVVSRIRHGLADAAWLRLSLVADNVRVGRALNSIRIAEILAQSYLD